MSNRVQVNNNQTNKLIIKLIKTEQKRLKENKRIEEELNEEINTLIRILDPKHPFEDPYNPFHTYFFKIQLLKQTQRSIEINHFWIRTYQGDINQRAH